MRPSEEGDHVDLCESARSPASVREVSGLKAVPRQYDEDVEQADCEVGQLYNDACPSPRP